MWSPNHFLLSGPASCRPSSRVQGFKGNNISTTKRRQPTEAHEERLGHPPNQCPRELARAIPTRACPGNVLHPSTCMHTDTVLPTSKKSFYAWYDDLVGSPLSPAPTQRVTDSRLKFEQNASYLQLCAKDQGSSCVVLFIICFGAQSKPV